jgi:Helicase conserved C-terminal domain
MDSTTNTCYLCENQFDVDELQKFQPGFVLDWRSNLETAHVQPIKESPINESSIIPAIEPLIRPPQARHRTKKPGDGHKCDYDIYASDGRCIYCLEEHNYCCLLNDRWRCNFCYRTSEECPTDESKSYFLSCRLLELHKQHDMVSFRHDDASPSHIMARPLKVIVFSQFRAALNFIGDRLLRKFGTACVAEFFGSHRKQELHKFTYEECCFCLLLTKDGSEGLDLSFVTNLIFLEEVFDKSLVDQVVARAWRMGANGRVTIETLIAKNTIEEVIAEQKQSLGEDSSDKAYSKNGDQQRLKSLLQSLRFIIDHQSPFPKNSLSIKQEDSLSIKPDVETRLMGGNSLKRSLPNTDSENILDQQSNRKSRVVRFVDTDKNLDAI